MDGRGREAEEVILIKSRDPHLPGGEKQHGIAFGGEGPIDRNKWTSLPRKGRRQDVWTMKLHGIHQRS